MERCPPQKLTVLGLTYILFLPTLALPASISLAETQVISSMAIFTRQMKEDSDNTGKHHDYDGTIDDYTEENRLGGDGYFDRF